jgi:hypothetical protein
LQTVDEFIAHRKAVFPFKVRDLAAKKTEAVVSHLII